MQHFARSCENLGGVGRPCPLDTHVTQTTTTAYLSHLLAGALVMAIGFAAHRANLCTQSRRSPR